MRKLPTPIPPGISTWRGGVALLSRITGLARSSIYADVKDIENNSVAGPGRMRKHGGGRNKNTVNEPTLLADMKADVEPETRGDPMKTLLWTTKSVRHLVDVLTEKGYCVSRMVVHGLLRGMGYSLQTNQKTLEGGQHADRDAQFNYINTKVNDFLSSKDPVISIDTKEK